MSQPKRAGSIFIIATKDRSDDLTKTVESLVAQTLLPSGLCIVDSSDETPGRGRIEELCADAALPLDYVHPAPRGLTVQRNIGIDRTAGDPVFLIDDDVWLAPDCHEEILAEYDRWGPDLGGVRAAPIRPARPPWYSVLWRKAFGFGGWWPEASGRLRSGLYIEAVSESPGVRRLDCFTGYFMSFRRKVFDYERFDEALAGYGHKEDIDFTYRVSRRFTLVQTPRAKCDHLRSMTSRLSTHQLLRMNLANQFYLHRKLMPQDFKHRFALWWALIGIFTLNVGRALRNRDSGLVTGMVAGAMEQASGKGLVDPAVERDAASPGATERSHNTK